MVKVVHKNSIDKCYTYEEFKDMLSPIGSGNFMFKGYKVIGGEHCDDYLITGVNAILQPGMLICLNNSYIIVDVLGEENLKKDYFTWIG